MHSALVIVRTHPPRTAPTFALVTIVVAALALATGCSRDASGDARVQDERDRRGSASSGTIAAPATAYKPSNVAATGVVSGRVLIEGDVPAAEVVRPTTDQANCEPTTADPSLVHQGPTLGNAVVWLSDVREGRPLPLERRYAVTQDGCLLDPRVQAIATGGTVNVRSVDPTTHFTVLLRAGTSDTVAVVRLNDDGQVVPDEHVGKRAGLVELRCEQHPWTHGWIAVFDHPYYAVTQADGAFRIEGVPPGKHTLMVWHERGGAPVSTVVEVGAGETRVDARVRLR